MSNRIRSWIKHILLFSLLSLLFSAIPLASSLLFDRSSLLLSLFIIWYALVPPFVFLLLGRYLYGDEDHWSLFVGRTWVALGIWFLTQYIFGLASGVSILFELLNLPATMVGDAYFLVGTLVFLGGGILLSIAGIRGLDLPDLNPIRGKRKVYLASTVALLAIMIIVQPAFIFLSSSPSPAEVEESQVPAESEIFGWIEDVYNFGRRRTGSEEDWGAIQYLDEKLREFGFDNVIVENYSGFDYWEIESWGLTLNPGTPEQKNLNSFYVPYTGPETVSGEMVYLGEGTEENFANKDVSGKVILVNLPPLDVSWSDQELFSYMAYDPGDTAEGWSHPYPIGWMGEYQEVYERAEEHAVAGIVGILENYPDMGEFTYYAPYDGEIRPIPSLYVTENTGELLESEVKGGTTTAKVLVDANVEEGGGETATVYGILPGQSESNIIVHSHHDSSWRSGVEDSSGVGMVLSLAKYFSQIPKSEREKTLIFTFTGSHFVGGPSNKAFLREHKDDFLRHTLYDICIEHIADDYRPPDWEGGGVEPRGVFITENPVVISRFAHMVARHDMNRTLLFPTGTPLGVPTDALSSAKEGISEDMGLPIVSQISGPTWLFDDDDTLERVARDELVPLTRTYVDFINQMSGIPPFLLHFNLNAWTILLVAVVLTPLATVSFASKSRENREEKS